MRTTARLMLGLALLAGGYAACTALCQAPATLPAESPAEKDARMAWWRAARFGLFIHWGLYAIPAGEWEGRTNHGEWILTTAQIPVAQYEHFREQFNPTRFDAAAWAQMAKDAGMQYIVITSKHHDGFCLFDSEHTDYDVMSTPFKRDVLRELAEATRRAGLRMCWYHSIMDWHHPDYLPRRTWEQRSAEGADFDRYIAYLKNQVRELVTKYGPIGVLWFDGEWEQTWMHAHGLDLYAYVRGLDPAIIINNRVDKGRNDMQGLTKGAEFAGDFGTPEQEVPPAGLPGVDWESCITMNDHWGYNKHDQNWKSSRELIRMLADIASKGGNFLLNVGPTAEGEFPPACVERLRDIGRWMKLNGEAIYGTQAGPFGKLPWGRCTQKALPDGHTRLYLHVFDWPAERTLTVHGLANKARTAYLLSDESRQPLQVDRAEDALVIRVPSAAPDSTNTVVVLDMAGRPDVVLPPTFAAPSDVFVDTLAVTIAAERPDVELRYTVDGTPPTAASSRVAGPLQLTRTTTVQARVFRDGQPVSDAGAATFTQVTPRPAVECGEMTNGLRYAYFEGDWERLPDFGALEPVARGNVADFDLTPRRINERYGLRYTGFIRVPSAGVYRFFVTSDDGSRLYIGDELVVDHDGLHSAGQRAGQLALAAGLHPICVDFFQRTGDVALEVAYAGPGIDRQRVPATALFRPDRGDDPANLPGR